MKKFQPTFAILKILLKSPNELNETRSLEWEAESSILGFIESKKLVLANLEGLPILKYSNPTKIISNVNIFTEIFEKVTFLLRVNPKPCILK